MSTEIDEILSELKRLRKELDELKSFDVPRPSGDFVRISGDTMTGYLGIGIAPDVPLKLNIPIDLRPAGVPATANMFRMEGGQGASIWGQRWDINIAGNVDTTSSKLIIAAGTNIFGSYGTADLLTLLNNGYFGLGTVNPTTKFSVAEKCAMNADGGFMVKLTNKTGGASVKGEVVMPYDTTNLAVAKIVKNEPDPIGVFYESGVADGAEAWIVVAGIADVYFIGNTTRGHLARGFITADAGYVIGQALSEAIPTSPFATDKHFYEIGHVLESRTGAGLAKCVLHFN